MILFEQLKSLPKVDLHVHFEGSLNTDTIRKLLKNKYESIEIEDMMVLSTKSSKDTYNKKYDLPIKMTQTKENIKELMSKLIEELEKDNIIYAEVRVMPSLHTKEGLTQLEVMESLIETTKKSNVKINFILEIIMENDEMNNIETLEVAKRLYQKGVVAFDLINTEKENTKNDYKYLFELANTYNIPYVLSSKTESQLKRNLKYHPKRIVNAIMNLKSESLKQEIYNEDIIIEVCPSSEIIMNYNEIEYYPIYSFYKEKHNIIIGSGNRTIFNTNLLNEYCKLVNNFPFTVEDFININTTAINSSFLSLSEKEELKKKYKN